MIEVRVKAYELILHYSFYRSINIKDFKDWN